MGTCGNLSTMIKTTTDTDVLWRLRVRASQLPRVSRDLQLTTLTDTSPQLLDALQNWPARDGCFICKYSGHSRRNCPLANVLATP